MKIYPIGTIIEISDKKLIILGYQHQIYNERFLNGYVVAPYPLGFTSMEDIKVVEAKHINTIVCEGFSENEMYQEFSRRKKKFFEKTQDMIPGNIQKGMELILNNIKLEESE